MFVCLVAPIIYIILWVVNNFMDTLKERLIFLLDRRKPYVFGAAIGWGNGVVDYVFRRGKPPGSDALAQLAQAERVNLTWLLTGDGVPYEVLPPPLPNATAVGPEWHYYLFAGPEGVQPPLVRVGPGLRVTVYNGAPADLGRAVEYLAWKDQPIYIAPESDSVAGLRLGMVGNRELLGLLEGDFVAIDPAMWRAVPRVEDRPAAYLEGPVADGCPRERDWLMLLRELPEDRREVLLTVARWLAG